MTHDLSSIISEELNIPRKSVNATIRLLDDGATIPFISRYRKEATGMLDEVAIHNIRLRMESLRELIKRKEYIISVLAEKNFLTDELKQRIDDCPDPSVLEDIYLPYKPKRRTRASVAREKGLEPLAKIIMAQHTDDIQRQARKFISSDVLNVDDAIAGASDIIAEWVSESEKGRALVRSRYLRSASISSKVISGKEDEGRIYQNYHNFSEPLRTCTSHRYLALRRGEAEGILKISLSIDDDEMIERLNRMFVRVSSLPACADIVRNAVKDSYRRLIRPSIEAEVSALTKEKADKSAIDMFAENIRQLLLAPPLFHKRVLAIDPGFRTGCKTVCLDEQGNLLHNDVIYPCAPANDYHGAAMKVSYLVEAYRIDAIAVGNGTAGRETEKFLSGIRYPHKIQIFSVNEAGASVYSASKIAREEFPDYDVTVRGAVSIGRRLIDPLAELVKIDPKSIGVGQYQHDVDQTKLKEALDYTVESCVNSVGININTASRQLLSYVSGIGKTLADNIVTYRIEHGDFSSRQQLLQVPRMGEKAFQQCAGFLRIPDAPNQLDNTGVHPESYGIVSAMAEDMGLTVEKLLTSPSSLKNIDLNRYVTKTTGLPTLTDIISELEKPGRDPRASAKVMEFDDRVTSLNDIKTGMELNGIVNNITAFGVFVDLGIKENGLVHISQLCERFISSPAEVVRVHQHVKVRVIDVDYDRKRIGLTMKGVAQ